jgi:hypothetical protein
LGGTISQYVVGYSANKRLVAFGIGTDNAAWHTYQVVPNGGWSGWTSLGGIVSDLAVATNNDGRLELFGVGADSALYHMSQVVPDGGWGAWTSLGGIVRKIVALRQPNGTIQVIGLGSDDNTWRIVQQQPGGNWSSWQPVSIEQGHDFGGLLGLVSFHSFTHSLAQGAAHLQALAHTLGLTHSEELTDSEEQTMEKEKVIDSWNECALGIAKTSLWAGAALGEAYAGNGPAAAGASARMLIASGSAAVACGKAVQRTQDYRQKYSQEPQEIQHVHEIDINPAPWRGPNTDIA